MEMTFRWYGKTDPVTLENIRQIPNVGGVVTAVYNVPAGEIWPNPAILEIKNLCESHGLKFEVVESVPVHEDIKLGKPTRDRLIENYVQTLRNLGQAGVKCVCYNFMPVFDWLRTTLSYPNEDGSVSLAYLEEDFKKLDKRNLHLPGWDESYSAEQLNGLLKEYETVTHEQLFDNLVYFLRAIMPVCDETGIDMAIHPDDPPWDIFGLPRIITGEKSYQKLFEAVPDLHNGITFCTGSLGACRANDLSKMAYEYSKQNRIKFAHLRNIRYLGDYGFAECSHYSKDGNLDLGKIVKALVKGGFKGYVRPDHGRNIWGESGKPGYGLFDRALGAAYLNGLFEANEKENNI